LSCRIFRVAFERQDLVISQKALDGLIGLIDLPDLRLDLSLPPLLERLKLDAALLDRFPSDVSGGEAQRLALARLLLLSPDFIVADEPTSRLDPIVALRSE
jgi:ABC-type dipeptide/oligopeptide/nickel transport system ATPase subunit